MRLTAAPRVFRDGGAAVTVIAGLLPAGALDRCAVGVAGAADPRRGRADSRAASGCTTTWATRPTTSSSPLPDGRPAGVARGGGGRAGRGSGGAHRGPVMVAGAVRSAGDRAPRLPRRRGRAAGALALRHGRHRRCAGDATTPRALRHRGAAGVLRALALQVAARCCCRRRSPHWSTRCGGGDRRGRSRRLAARRAVYPRRQRPSPRHSGRRSTVRPVMTFAAIMASRAIPT